jgi:hypothetical protein
MIAMLVDPVRFFQTKFEARRPGMHQEFEKYGRGSSLITMTGHSRLGRYAMSWKLIPKRFGKAFCTGQRTRVQAPNRE